MQVRSKQHTRANASEFGVNRLHLVQPAAVNRGLPYMGVYKLQARP